MNDPMNEEGRTPGAGPGERPEKRSGEPPRGRVPLVLKLFGALCILGGLSSLGDLVPVIVSFAQGIAGGGYRTASVVIFAALMAVLAASAVLFVVLGYRLLRNRRAHAAQAANVLVALTVLAVIGTLMLFGLSAHHIGYLVQIVILIAVTSYLDPQLYEERRLQRSLRKMDKEQRAEERRLARERTPKKGFITLNFFNLFWIFVVCCVLGLLIETVYHFIMFGGYEDRAGMLFGPFSPIYGFGALLMTIALNRFHDKPVWVVFLVSAVIGGAFEYFTSWIMEFSFGIRAWDYSGTFLSIDGRTNFVFMAMWGVLGVAWIKLLLPQLLKLINLIPWNWRYTVTAVCTVLMLVDGVMTVQSIDCWYQRMAGKAPDTPIEEFYAKRFDNDYMEHRFQTMTMDPNDATRADVR